MQINVLINASATDSAVASLKGIAKQSLYKKSIEMLRCIARASHDVVSWRRVFAPYGSVRERERERDRTQ